MKSEKAKAPQVYCAHSEIVPLRNLKPHPQNPNKHPKEQVELLAKIIDTHGWRQPITVSNRSGYVVRGHGRLEAAALLGCVNAPVDYQDYANEQEELADMVADNRIAELSERDNDILRDVLKDLDTGLFDMDLTGYELKDLQDILTPPQTSVKESQAPTVTVVNFSFGKIKGKVLAEVHKEFLQVFEAVKEAYDCDAAGALEMILLNAKTIFDPRNQVTDDSRKKELLNRVLNALPADSNNLQ